MKVSVIVPVYNSAKYLEECLNSIISQDYKDLEIILIDDGSQDNSGEICDHYKEQDNRIKVIHQSNKGVSNARNQGLKIACGELIMFVDSDDIVEPDMISTLYNDINNSQADVAICSYSLMKNNSITSIGNSGKSYLFSNDEAINNLISGKYFTGGLWAKVFKSDIIKNQKMDEKLKINEDVLMAFQVFEKSQKIFFHDTCLYNYRANYNGATNTIDAVIGRNDEFYVAKKIYENSLGKPYCRVAENRYYISMLNYYQSYVMSGRNDEEEAIQLKQKLKNEKAIRKLKTRPQQIRCFLFVTFPGIAKTIYQIYEKNRTVRHAPIFE